MARREERTDKQWATLEPLILATARRADGRGRLQLHNDRALLEGFLWVLGTGAAWADLPDRFPSGCTCFRCLTRWVTVGMARHTLGSLVRRPEETGRAEMRAMPDRRRTVTEEKCDKQ